MEQNSDEASQQPPSLGASMSQPPCSAGASEASTRLSTAGLSLKGTSTSKVNHHLAQEVSVKDHVLGATFLAEVADIETRLRSHILELLEPTIKKHSMLESRVRENRAMIDARSGEMAEIRKAKQDAEHFYKEVEGFRNELAHWDEERRTQEQRVGERLSSQELDIHSIRCTLERSQLDASSVNRTLVGLGDGLAAARAETAQLRSFAVERMDLTRDKGMKLRDEFEQRTTAVENQMHRLQDAQASAEKILRHLSKTMSTMQDRVQAADDNIADIWRSKASVANLERQQQELSEFMNFVNTTVSSLKKQFGSLIDDVKNHFQEAVNVVGITTEKQIEDMRHQCMVELQRVDQVQEEIRLFVDKSKDSHNAMSAEVGSVRDSTHLDVQGLKKEFEGLERKRQLGETNMGVELAQLRKQITDMQTAVCSQENSTGSSSDIMEMLVESNILSAMLDMQDDADRKNIALFGYKSCETGKDKSCSLPDVHSGGGISARSPRKRGQGVGVDATGVGSVVSLDTRCLSCSGSTDVVLSGFKMACLTYAPGQVDIGNSSYDRAELITQRLDMLKHAKEQLKARVIE
jgi:hypothetical protein